MNPLAQHLRFQAVRLVVTFTTIALGGSIVFAQGTPAQEVQAQVNAFWNAKITHCGSGNFYVGYSNDQVQQIVDARWNTQTKPLSGADVANGIRFRGTSQLSGSRNRYFMPGKGGWQPWEDSLGQLGFALSVDVESVNGRWSFKPNSWGPVDQMFAIGCDRVPKDAPAAGAATSQRANAEACKRALNPDAYSPGPFTVSNVSGDAIRQLVEFGDPNSCLDASGRNLLMIIAMQERWMWQDSALWLIRSGKLNLNAKDKFGYPALVYLLIRYHSTEAISPSYLESYQRVIDELIHRGAVTAPWYAPDGKRVLWSKVPGAFPDDAAAATSAGIPRKQSKTIPDVMVEARTRYPHARLFLVRHDHNGRSPLVGKDATAWTYCEGVLAVSPDKVIFEPSISRDGQMHGFLQPRGGIAEIKLTGSAIQGRNSFYLKFSGQTLNFVGVRVDAPVIVSAFN